MAVLLAADIFSNNPVGFLEHRTREISRSATALVIIT